MKLFYRQHQEKINYLLVGGWNTVFGYFIFVLLYYLLVHRLHYMLIFIISNIISISNAYVGYKTFVFKTKGNYLREYIRFYMVYSTALIINLGLLPLAVEFIHLSPLSAQGIIMVVNVIFSYFGHKYFSFGGKKATST